MDVKIPRGAVESLLKYAAEFQSRSVDLNLQGDAYDVVELVKQAMHNQKHQPIGVDVRHPMLEMGDKIGQLRDACRLEPEMAKDEILTGILHSLLEEYGRLCDHLNAHYAWD